MLSVQQSQRVYPVDDVSQPAGLFPELEPSEEMMKKPHRKAYGPTGIKHGSNERQLKKYIGKRISEDDHLLLTRYAASLNLDVSALLAPHVESLVEAARQHESVRETVLAAQPS